MIVSFLKYERNRVLSEKMKNRTITLNFLEKNLVYEFIHNDIQLKLTGNTDRVETINGETFIYDYKSGTESAINISSQNDFFTVKNAKSIQLLMYAYLYEKSMLNVDTLYSGIIWLRSVKGKFDLLEIDIVANLNDANFDFFETNLLQLIDMMFDEKIPITKTDDCNNCKFCLYTGICGR